ncbi:hypothetical protein BJ170DRAFT_32595 [Xylariales sp. AK1849]|nr:hypothetical protein BJ170DRAFT_32595 [Xylariales sp. AK1849]
MSLNFSMPDDWASYDPLVTLESVAMYLPCFSPGAVTSQRISETIHQVANTYIATDGNATYDDVASVLQITTDDVATLSTAFGGDSDMQQLILWASSYMNQAPTYYVDIGIFAMVCIFVFISGVTTVLRVYSRWRCHDKGVTITDYFVIAAFCSALIMSANFGNNIVMLYHQGLGAIWGITFDALQLTQLHALFESAIYHVVILLLKMSILLFYGALTDTKSYQRYVVYFISFIVLVSNTFGFFLQIFGCNPIAWWTNWLAFGCVAWQTTATFAIAIVNMVTDVVLCVLPIPALVSLPINQKTRILAFLVLATGAIPCVFSIVRCIYLWTGYGSVVYGNMADFTFSTYSQIEIHLMIWACNVPAIRALYVSRKERRAALAFARSGGSGGIGMNRNMSSPSKTPIQAVDSGIGSEKEDA